MNIIIIEDETPAARRLEKMVLQIDPNITVIAKLDSIEGAVNWFKNNPQPDLVLLDIELADGQSFEIFNLITVTAPVIFTTAYDAFALKAFQVNSIDYLLKPIEEELLRKALDKFAKLKNQLKGGETVSLEIEKLVRTLALQKQFKSRFLVKQGEKLISIDVDQIAYCMSEEKLSFLVTHEGKKYVMDDTLDVLEGQLDYKIFFRLNRQFIAHIKSIHSINTYFNGKLKLSLKPDAKEEVIVSRDKAPYFKEWLNS